MYDAIIIGGGPGGYACAIRASQLGGKVCLIENGNLGGTCTNRGCIPTKALLASASFLKKAKNSKKLGIELENPMINFSDVMKRMERIVNTSRLGIEKILESKKVEVIKGRGKLVSKNEVEVNGKRISGKNIVIATGSVPVSIPGIEVIYEFNNKKNNKIIINSDVIFQMDVLPKSICIIGGGYIGIEFANIFNIFGSKVFVIELMPKILSGIDEEAADLMTKILERAGVEIYTGSKIESIKDGKIIFQQNKVNKIIKSDVVFLAAGRRPNFEKCEIESIGVKFDKNGIVADSHMKTNIKNIYAIGDVNGKYPLAHVANMEGIIAAENIMGKKSEMNYEAVPSCIFTLPEIACVGKQGEKMGKFLFAASGRARTIDEIEGFVKIFADKKNRLVGASMIGPNVSEIIQEITLAVQNNLTVENLLKTIHPHPTISESVYEAVADINNEAIHN